MNEEGLPKRKTIRLKNYDYSQAGYYFITICSHNRKNIFSNIINQNVELTDIGKEIEESLENLSSIFNRINIDQYVIMPNHIHLITILKNEMKGHK